MNPRPILVALLLAAGFSGCATFTDAEIGQIRQHGVSPAVVGKMQDGRELHPGDVIELTRRGVPDGLIIRQIDDVGVDYVLNRDDVKRMQNARVSRPVIDALVAASDDFASRYSPSHHVRVYAGDPYDPYYYGPYYGPYYYPYGGISVGIGGGHWGHCHR